MKNIKSIGILGSGQLGRMISNAASKFGIKSHIYAPDAFNSPASQVSYDFTNAPYENTEELKNFVNSVDVVTCEFENVPFQTAEFLLKHGFVDRIVERKNLAYEIGLLLSILLKKNSEVNSENNEQTSELSIKTREAS